MRQDQKTKILIMAGALVLAIAVFVVVILFGGKPKQTAQTPPGAPPGVTTPAPSATPSTAPPSTSAPAQRAPVYTPPAPPPVKSAGPMMALVDPFTGGPWTPPSKIKPPPDRVYVLNVPPISPKSGRARRGRREVGGQIVEKTPPVGRHAGWIFNSNGQVVAIFEDSAGIARAVRVGDEIQGDEGILRVKAISPDYLLLVDANTGQEIRIKLEGLDTYPGKTREVGVEAVPRVPAWEGAG